MVPLPSKMEHSALIIGIRIPLLAGTVHVRLLVPPGFPARNHTGPCWFTAQLAPVWSSTGLLGSEILAAHRHQAADHWP